MKIDTLLIVGLGLLGGSVARAARARGVAGKITAWARPGRSQDEAQAAGIVDEWSHDLQALCGAADLIVLAQPVESLRASLPEVLGSASRGAIVTDVGSTKGELVATAEEISSQAFFVGSHPMAGSHLTGWQHSTADLFINRTCFVTPTPRTSLEAAARVSTFWQSLGGRAVVVDPQRHDALCALVSHIPHFTAVSLMQLIADCGEDPTLLRALAANGFRDTTRVAMGDSAMWVEIARQNHREIAAGLRQLADHINRVADEVESGDDALGGKLTRLAELRSEFQREA